MINHLIVDTMCEAHFTISLHDLIISLSKTIDLISPQIMGHHLRVAYLSVCLVEEAGFSVDEQQAVLLAGALHDIGALSLQDRLDCLEFDDEKKNSHAAAGYYLLRPFTRLRQIAELVRDHHLSWEKEPTSGTSHSRLCHWIHLADRIDVLLDPQKEILSQIPQVKEMIQKRSGTFFDPESVRIFSYLTKKESIWFDLVSPFLDQLVQEKFVYPGPQLDLDELIDFSKIISHVIDFRSPFTATHSRGVSSVAAGLARIMGLSSDTQKKLTTTGYLHDLGKLAIPLEILNKQSALTPFEFNIIKQHPYYTYRLLKPVKAAEEIVRWSSYHHEKPNGHGYPFKIHSDHLNLESRLISVCDVFTALSEDRPYRKGMAEQQIKDTILKMVQNGELENKATAPLLDCFSELNAKRIDAQSHAKVDYRKFENSKG